MKKLVAYTVIFILIITMVACSGNIDALITNNEAENSTVISGENSDISTGLSGATSTSAASVAEVLADNIISGY